MHRQVGDLVLDQSGIARRGLLVRHLVLPGDLAGTAEVAPEIIDRAMMDHPCAEVDAETFPALERLRQARATESMPGPLAAAQRLISILPHLKD
jgi:putative pyruvate formate lyase activating enzyme